MPIGIRKGHQHISETGGSDLTLACRAGGKVCRRARSQQARRLDTDVETLIAAERTAERGTVIPVIRDARRIAPIGSASATSPSWSARRADGDRQARGRRGRAGAGTGHRARQGSRSAEPVEAREVSGMSALGGGAETFCSIIVLRLMTRSGNRSLHIISNRFHFWVKLFLCNSALQLCKLARDASMRPRYTSARTSQSGAMDRTLGAFDALFNAYPDVRMRGPNVSLGRRHARAV